MDMTNPDPLGIGLKSRAAQRRQDFTNQHLGMNMGPLADPQWDAFFQALEEQGVDRMADDSVGRGKGMWGAQPTTIADPIGEEMRTFDPFQGQRSAAGGTSPLIDKQGQQVGYRFTPRASKHIGAGRGASLQALFNVTGRR